MGACWAPLSVWLQRTHSASWSNDLTQNQTMFYVSILPPSCNDNYWLGPESPYSSSWRLLPVNHFTSCCWSEILHKSNQQTTGAKKVFRTEMCLCKVSRKCNTVKKDTMQWKKDYRARNLDQHGCHLGCISLSHPMTTLLYSKGATHGHPELVQWW